MLQISLVYVNTLTIQQVLGEDRWVNAMSPDDLARPESAPVQPREPLSGRFRGRGPFGGRGGRRWIGRFAEIGEKLEQPSADGCVSFHLTRPAALDGVVDALLLQPGE